MTRFARGLRCVAAACVAAILLAACGGGGGGGDAPPAPGPSKLFILDAGNRAIASVANAHPTAGPLVVDRVITSPGLAVFDRTLVLDTAKDRLFVNDSFRVLVFDNASTSNGSLPVKFIQNANGNTIPTGSFISIISLFADPVNSLLYVTDVNGGVGARPVIVVFNSLASGSLVPLRTVSLDTAILTGGHLFVDTGRNILYKTIQCGIVVFDGASTLDGLKSAGDRQFGGCPQVGGAAIWVDTTRDILYAIDQSASGVSVFNNASALNNPMSGSVSADRAIIGFPPSSLHNLFVDSVNNRLYATIADRVILIDNASTANGLLGIAVPALQASGAAGSNLHGIAVNTAP